MESLANRIKLSWTDELSFEALLKQASALPPHTAIFWELMIVDAAGVVHEGGAPLARLHAVANAPIFSYDESFFGNAIVGGPLLLAADTYPAGAVPSWRTEGTPTLREKSRTRANARAEMSPTGPVREANGQRHQLEERAAHGASRGRGKH